MPSMRNLLKYPITPKEVIDYLKYNVEAETFVDDAMGNPIGGLGPLHAQTALAVVRAAALIVQNDIGSTSAELLAAAFNSQNVRQPSEEKYDEALAVVE